MPPRSCLLKLRDDVLHRWEARGCDVRHRCPECVALRGIHADDLAVTLGKLRSKPRRRLLLPPPRDVFIGLHLRKHGSRPKRVPTVLPLLFQGLEHVWSLSVPQLLTSDKQALQIVHPTERQLDWPPETAKWTLPQGRAASVAWLYEIPTSGSLSQPSTSTIRGVSASLFDSARGCRINPERVPHRGGRGTPVEGSLH